MNNFFASVDGMKSCFTTIYFFRFVFSTILLEVDCDGSNRSAN